MNSRTAPKQRRQRRHGAALVLGLSLSSLGSLPLQASSPQAWEAYGRQVLQACTAASGLRHPRPAGERVDMPSADGSPTSVLLLKGRYPQAHMAGMTGLELCLYEGRSRKARVAEADRQMSPQAQPKP